MEWLNYHHLLYFWTVAKEGGLKPAAQKLRLAHPTLSGQIHTLEDRLGQKLFSRAGRRLELTEAGRLAFRYADEIFGLGQELLDALHDRPTGQPLRLQLGVADALPKLVVARLVEPALSLAEPVRLVCREDKPERLFAALGLHELDVVLTDAPASGAVRAHSHLLGTSPVGLFAAPALARSLRRGFPGSLAGAPMLLPGEATALSRALAHWLEGHGVRPRVVGELDDSALTSVLAAEERGVCAAPLVVADELAARYRLVSLGEAEGVRESFYAVTVARRLSHPAVLAITQAARADLFATRG